MLQQSYIKIILERIKKGDCKPIGTPLNAKTSLPKLSDKEHEEHLQKMKEILYQETLCSLMYAMVATRLGPAFAVSVISVFMSKLGSIHLMVIK